MKSFIELLFGYHFHSWHYEDLDHDGHFMTRWCRCGRIQKMHAIHDQEGGTGYGGTWKEASTFRIKEQVKDR